jgi:hypothetical protein
MRRTLRRLDYVIKAQIPVLGIAPLVLALTARASPSAPQQKNPRYSPDMKCDLPKGENQRKQSDLPKERINGLMCTYGAMNAYIYMWKNARHLFLLLISPQQYRAYSEGAFHFSPTC